ncbi:MAG: LamG domain-containing protein [Opitutaceae bacterium]|jgi:hypothetical protein|nr:LamG domain-containing protein [Opitutaceae bacterium]
MKNHARSVFLPALAAVFAVALPAQVVRYGFDSTYKLGAAQWTPNTGAGGEKSAKGAVQINSLDLRMFAAGGANADLATAPGVAGRGRALDLTGNTPGTVNAAIAQQNAAAPGAFKALTITGWMKHAAPLQKDMTLIRNFATGPSGGGFWIFATGPGTLVLQLGDGQKSAKFPVRAPAVAVPDQWVFFAASWDGGAGLANWYFGDEAGAPAAPVRVAAPASTGMTLTATKHLAVGRASSKSPGFCGLFDDIRIFDTALAQEKIEEIRQSALDR